MPRNTPMQQTPLTAEQRDWIERNMALVYHVARKPKHRWLVDRLGLEEVAQHGLAAMCRAVQTFDPRHGASLPTHVVGCVEFQIIGLAGRTLRDPHRQLPEDEENPDAAELLFGTSEPEHVEATERRLEAARLLRALSPRERAVILLAFGLDGYPEMRMKPIEHALGLNRGVGEMRKQNAIKRLRCVFAPGRVS